MIEVHFDDDKFSTYIANVLTETGLTDILVQECVSKDNLAYFKQAFTSPSVDKTCNYALFEQLGDVTVNKFIVQYMYNIFPQLQTSDGVNVVARLKIYYGGKRFLQKFAEQLEMWNFIQVSDDERVKKRKIVTEDVFESFVGCVEFIVGTVVDRKYSHFGKAAGFHIAFRLLSNLYSKITPVIQYETLVDPKTRLKELFDEKRTKMGPLVFTDTRDPDTAEYVTQVRDGNRVLSMAKSVMKREAHEQASQKALDYLRMFRITKKAPHHYENFKRCTPRFQKRSPEFTRFVLSILHFSSLPEKWIRFCVSDESIALFSSALTSKSVDPCSNYEFFEQLGDASINKFIVQYMYARYPHLANSAGINVVARLKIKYGSRGQLYQMADKLSFWKFILAGVDEKNKRKKSLLEDTFEAFFGCVEFVLDEAVRREKKQHLFGFGYSYVFEMLAHIFDQIDVPFAYEKLVDNKTRLKELFDENKNQLGVLSYEDSRCKATGFYISRAKNNEEILASGSSTLKKDAQERASENALKILAKRGITKIVPHQYTNNLRE